MCLLIFKKTGKGACSTLYAFAEKRNNISLIDNHFTLSFQHETDCIILLNMQVTRPVYIRPFIEKGKSIATGKPFML